MFLYVFLLFHGNSNYFRFCSGTSCCFQLYRLDKFVIKVVFLLYLMFFLILLNCSSINVRFFCSLLIKLLLLPFCNICYAPSLASLRLFYVSIEYFKHVLYTVLLLPSLTGQDEYTWLGPFE